MSFDLQIIELMGQWRTPFLSQFMNIATGLGAKNVIISLIILTGLALVGLKKYNYLTVLLISFFGEELIISLIKHLVARPRPEILTHLTYADGFSFPSGHSSAAIVFYGLIGYFLAQEFKSRWAKILSWTVLSLIILAVGLSRIYLGVHWPTDVLGGYAIITAWLILVLFIFKRKHYV